MIFANNRERLACTFLVMIFIPALGMSGNTAEVADGPEHRWRVDDNSFSITGKFVAVRDELVVVREEPGGVSEIPLDLLAPMDRYHALKWEGERRVFPPFVGLELPALVLPQERMPLDQALDFLWTQAREVRPELPEQGPRVEIIGARRTPSVSANITGRLDAMYALTLLCEMVRFHWVYDEDRIIVGPRSAMENVASFREKERFLREHEERMNPLRQELGTEVTFEIKVMERPPIRD